MNGFSKGTIVVDSMYNFVKESIGCEGIGRRRVLLESYYKL